MLTLIRNGGFPMFFILAFGLVGLAAAGWYAFRPNARSMGFIVWIGGATLFSTLMGTVAAFGAVFFAVAHMIVEKMPDWHAVLIEGLAESMSAGIMGFAFLSVTCLLVAVGKARG